MSWKVLMILLLSVLMGLSAYAQDFNLVKNPGFENFTDCPLADQPLSQKNAVSFWNASHSEFLVNPDIYSHCKDTSHIIFLLPSVYWGPNVEIRKESPGGVVSGLYSIISHKNYIRHEYLGGELWDKLNPEIEYDVSFWTVNTGIEKSTGERSQAVWQGLSFQEQPYLVPNGGLGVNLHLVDAAPDLRSPIITHEMGWTKVKGVYKTEQENIQYFLTGFLFNHGASFISNQVLRKNYPVRGVDFIGSENSENINAYYYYDDFKVSCEPKLELTVNDRKELKEIFCTNEVIVDTGNSQNISSSKLSLKLDGDELLNIKADKKPGLEFLNDYLKEGINLHNKTLEVNFSGQCHKGSRPELSSPLHEISFKTKLKAPEIDFKIDANRIYSSEKADVLVLAGQRVRLVDTSVKQGERRVWMIEHPEFDTPQTGKSVDVIWRKSGVYTIGLKVFYNDYCYREIEKKVEVLKENVFIPNVFSPNGDGKNDEFEVFSASPFEVVDFVVFDRFGNSVYKQRSGNFIKWSGGRIGVGVYTYVFRYRVLKLGNKVFERSGDLTIVR